MRLEGVQSVRETSLITKLHLERAPWQNLHDRPDLTGGKADLRQIGDKGHGIEQLDE
jgi:hypothetical protein